MLKLILSLVLLAVIGGNLYVGYLGLFVIRFIFMVGCCHDFYTHEVGFALGGDYVGCIIIFLRLWIISLIILARQNVKNLKNSYNIFIMVNLILLVALVVTFSSLNYMLFYVRFEASLIPTLILILG